MHEDQQERTPGGKKLLDGWSVCVCVILAEMRLQGACRKAIQQFINHLRLAGKYLNEHLMKTYRIANE